MQEQWQESLLSWQYPDSTLTPMTAAVLVGQKGSSFMDDRRATWQTAFSSLYYGLRQGRCPAFYFVTPEVGFPRSLAQLTRVGSVPQLRRPVEKPVVLFAY